MKSRIGRVIKVVAIESLQNLPMVLGFLIAARLFRENLWLSFLFLFIGVALGIVTMHYTEPRLHKQKYEVNWKGDLLNFGLFVALAVPFLFYFTSENRWINWRTDLILGALAGGALTVGQSLGWKGSKERMVIHGAAMCLSFPLILVGLRFACKVPSWGWALLLGTGITVLASLVIALIDYQEMMKSEN